MESLSSESKSIALDILEDISGKVSTIPGMCQLVQENDCQPHQEKSNKLSTEIRKRQVLNEIGTLVHWYISNFQ